MERMRSRALEAAHTDHRKGVQSTVRSNARVESLNTRIRLLTRRAYGFHSAGALIGLAMLSFGGLQLTLPGRAA